MKYLEAEFSSENLKFYLACKELECIPSPIEWSEKALQIYNEYIPPHSQFEINIDASVRQSIIDQFTKIQEMEKSNSLKGNELSIYVFSDAVQKIFTLMNKDSYPRFVASLNKA
jgi:regulator of G-protein signaling